MPKQYGSNGINSNGSLMNVGNTIWDPSNGGRPSIRIFKDNNAMAKTQPPWLLDCEPISLDKTNATTNTNNLDKTKTTTNTNNLDKTNTNNNTNKNTSN